MTNCQVTGTETIHALKNTYRQDTGGSSSWVFEERLIKGLDKGMAGLGVARRNTAVPQD